MDKLIPFTSTDLGKITNHRNGEIKFGEKMITVPKGVDPLEFLATCDAKYVVFGIPEDIGIRANYGRPGAASAWKSAIKSIANIQHNRFCKGNQIVILGTINVDNEMAEVPHLDFNDIDDRSKLSQLVEKIDKEVSHLIFHITKLGKTPIIIGGGQNNAYGNIKGTALSKGKPINAINFDAHSDFRILEGRHNGNAFSYAFEEGFLSKYYVFGLHENHVTKSVLDSFKKLEDRLHYVTYDSIRIRKEKDFDEEMVQASEFITQEPFGLEIDLGAIPNIASSTMTLTGFSVEELRHFVSYFGKFKNVAYLHLCEGAPELGEEKNDHLIGKIIGHLITDFIKSNYEKVIPQVEELQN